MKPLTLRTALATGALTGWLTILGTYGCQPTAPAPTLTELMIAPVKAPSAPASTPIQSLPPLAFGFKVGETIPYTEDLTVKTVQTSPYLSFLLITKSTQYVHLQSLSCFSIKANLNPIYLVIVNPHLTLVVAR